MQGLPHNLTLLFTDVENSTELWEQHAELMDEAMAAHDRLVREAVELHGGKVVKSTGDGVFATFDDALCGLQTGVEIQRVLVDAGGSKVPLRVRCGIHAGAVQLRGGDVFGPAVNKAARIMSLAHAGQVLASQAVEALVRERLHVPFALRDLGTVRLKGISVPERVYQVLHPFIGERFPALRSQEHAPTNVPEPTTQLVGRASERSTAKRLLRTHRMVTLTGMGGIGKTRLAAEIARELCEQYPDGTWWVDLAPAARAEAVAEALASVLALEENPDVPVIDTVVRHLAGQTCLIILDNCEHLVAACAQFAESLLARAAGVRIIATSREPLHVRGESVLAVPPLATPTQRDSAEQIATSAAVRLFVQRAKAARAGFRLNAHNAPTIAAICRQVDGLPLALELAAAQIRALSETEIARQFSQRLLAQSAPGATTTSARQRTLRAVMDWSYELLQEHERAVFRKLAVFRGTFSLDAALKVCGQAADAASVERFVRLVDKSLVVAHPELGRYSLLEPVREYALEELAQAGEVGEARSQHLGFYLALAEQARPELLGAGQAEWLSLLDLEKDNLVAAFACASEEAAPSASGLRLVIALDNYWTRRGLLPLGYALANNILIAPNASAATEHRSAALLATAWIACMMGRYEAGLCLLNESLGISKSLGDEGRAMDALQGLAMASLGAGDVATARDYGEKALAAARSAGKSRRIMGSLGVLTEILRVQGDMAAAERCCEEALQLARAHSENEATGVSLLNLASIALARNDPHRARELLAEALAIVDANGLVRAGQLGLDVCAAYAAEIGKPAEAIRWYRASNALAAKLGVQRAPADESFLQPLIARAEADLGSDATAAALADAEDVNAYEVCRSAHAWVIGAARGGSSAMGAPEGRRATRAMRSRR